MGKFVIKTTAAGVKFDLKATNGVDSVKRNAVDAPTVEEE